MAVRRASDILASLRQSSLALPSPPARLLPPFFHVLLFVLYIEFYIPRLDLILFRVKLFILFRAEPHPCRPGTPVFSPYRSRFAVYFARLAIIHISHLLFSRNLIAAIVSGFFSLLFLSILALVMSDADRNATRECNAVYPSRGEKNSRYTVACFWSKRIRLSATVRAMDCSMRSVTEAE